MSRNERHTVTVLDDLCDGDTYASFTQTWTDTMRDGKPAIYFQFFHPKLNAMRCTCDAFKYTPAWRTYPGELKTNEGMYNYVFITGGRIQSGCKHLDACMTQIEGLTSALWEAYESSNWFESQCTA